MQKIRKAGQGKTSRQLLGRLRLSPVLAGLAFGVAASFSATGENSEQDPASSQSYLTATDFFRS